MLKFLAKGSSVLASVIVAGTTPIATLAQSTPAPVNPPATAPALLLIQGRVTRIQGNIVTVRTPDTSSTCPPNIPCLPTTFVGTTFNVDISSAIFQSATGSRILTPPALIIGDSIVVAGRQGVTPPVVIPSPAAPPRLIIAEVVTMDAI